MVMEEDSCSKCRESKSQHHILDGHFSHFFVEKIVMCVWKDENKLKRDQGCPIFKRRTKLGRFNFVNKFQIQVSFLL